MNTDRCKAIVERDRRVIAPCQHLSYFPLVVEKCEGAVITDADGNEYIDFLSSASSLNLGGAHPVVNAAITEQLQRCAQYTIAYSYSEQNVALAERLVSAYPDGITAKVAFGNCGSDANDAAVKFARAYTGRTKIIVFQNGYHGSTYGSATMSTCSEKIHDRMGPFLPDIYVFPFFGTDVDDAACERDCVSGMMHAFSSWLPADEVAAVVIEPLQGDGGLLPAHPIFMNKLYALCKANGILFISEEVQQGFYRTGKLFSIEHYGIVPDGIIMGKAFGAGLTLGAFMARAQIMDCLPAPAHVFTMSGNALACAAACAALDIYRSEQFLEMLRQNTECLEREARLLAQRHPDIVLFVRGLGMSMGIGICQTAADGSRHGDAKATFKIVYRCYEKGLILISVAGHVLRIQPPLVITQVQIEKAFAIISESMDDLRSGNIGDDVLIHRQGW